MVYSGGTYNVDTGTYVGGSAGAGVSTAIGYTNSLSTQYIGSTRTSIFRRRIARPKREMVTYEGAGIPGEEQTKEPTIALKNVFASTPTQRQTYVKETQGYNVKVQDYNKKIKDAKQQVDKYNQEVKEWNEKGRFQTVTSRQSYTPQYTVSLEPGEGLKQTDTSSFKQTPINNYFTSQKDKLNILTSFSKKPTGLIIGQFTTGAPPKLEKQTKFGKVVNFEQDLDNFQEKLKLYKSSSNPFVGAGASLGVVASSAVTFLPLQVAKLGYLPESFGVYYKQKKAGAPSTSSYSQFIKKESARYSAFEPGETESISRLTKPQQAYYQTFLKRPEESFGEQISIAGYLYGAERGYAFLTKPKLVEAPTFKTTITEVKTPEALKNIAPGDTVTFTKFRTTSPKIESAYGNTRVSDIYFTKSGKPIPVTKAFYKGKYYSFEPANVIAPKGQVYGNRSSKPFWEDNLLTYTETTKPKQLALPDYKVQRPLQLTKKDWNPMVIGERGLEKSARTFAYGFKGTESQADDVFTAVAKYYEKPSITYTYMSGKGTYNIKNLQKGKFAIADLDISAVYPMKQTYLGKKLKSGLTYQESMDLSTGKKSEMFFIDEGAVPASTISKTSKGFRIDPKFKSENTDVIRRFIGKSGDDKFYGIQYATNSPIGSAKDIDETLKIAGMRQRPLLEQTAQSFRLYPPALSEPVVKLPPVELASFNLKGYDRASGLENFRRFMIKERTPVITSKQTSEQLDKALGKAKEPFSTLETGLTEKQRLSYINRLARLRKDEPFIDVVKDDTKPVFTLEIKPKKNVLENIYKSPKTETIDAPKMSVTSRFGSLQEPKFSTPKTSSKLPSQTRDLGYKSYSTIGMNPFATRFNSSMDNSLNLLYQKKRVDLIKPKKKPTLKIVGDVAISIKPNVSPEIIAPILKVKPETKTMSDIMIKTKPTTTYEQTHKYLNLELKQEQSRARTRNTQNTINETKFSQVNNFKYKSKLNYFEPKLKVNTSLGLDYNKGYTTAGQISKVINNLDFNQQKGYRQPSPVPSPVPGLRLDLGYDYNTLDNTLDNTYNFNEPRFKFKTPSQPPFRPGLGGGAVIIPKLGGSENKKAKDTTAYDTYVLEKGNWIKANKGNEKSNYYGALKLGADVTDNSSARSFKIKPTTGKVTNYHPYQPQLIKFYQPSKTGKPKLTTAFIEKTKYLIDTQGERQQITAKGIIANRRKTLGGFRL